MTNLFMILRFYLKGYFIARKQPYIAGLAFLAPLSILPFMLSNLGLSTLVTSISAASSIWIFVLVTTLALTDRIWPQSHSGIYALYGVSKIPLSTIYNGYSLGFIISTLWPIIICIPIAGLFWGIPLYMSLIICLTVLIGCISIGYVASWLGLLSLHMRHAYAILLFLGLPLLTPNVIFGLSAVEHYVMSESPTNDLLLLIAYGMVIVLICQGLGYLTLKLTIDNHST